MRKDEILKLLIQHKPKQIWRPDITGLALFGSTVRNPACPDSDNATLWDAD